MPRFNSLYTLHVEFAYVTVSTERLELESTTLVESIDNDQTMEFQVQFKLLPQLWIKMQ